MNSFSGGVASESPIHDSRSAAKSEHDRRMIAASLTAGAGAAPLRSLRETKRRQLVLLAARTKAASSAKRGYPNTPRHATGQLLVLHQVIE
jgi:hypothetical protein